MKQSRTIATLACLYVAAGLWFDSAGAAAAEPDWSAPAKVLERAVADRAFPGCVACVGNREGVLWTGAFGRQTYDAGSAAVTAETYYDLASLTKVVGTTSVVMGLVRDKKLTVGDPLEKWVPAFVTSAADAKDRELRRRVTIEHLLTHSSGLPAGRPLHQTAKSYREVVAGAAAVPLDAPPGTKTVYSDLGYILLGEAASVAGGKPLADLEKSLLFEPLGMKQSLRRPPQELWPHIAPTERQAGKGPHDFWRGVVHDENARAGEGLTGHAGLFATAADVGRLARELLRARHGESKVFSRELATQFTTRRNLVAESSRALGWDTPSGKSSAGDLFSRQSFGHTGFTGTSIWIDPERELFAVLLTNRVHPTRANQQIANVRRSFADAVARNWVSREAAKNAKARSGE